MTRHTSLPGVRTPGVGFDQPFEMLEACHDRVRRSLKLLGVLRAYIKTKGVDDSARQAARDVQRYFDLAAPLHHQDEELHVFPALEAQFANDAGIMDMVSELKQDHIAMEGLWNAVVRHALAALADGQQATFTPEQEQAFDTFTALYDRHLELEDGGAYPAARKSVSAAQQESMGSEMAARRKQR
ncbi:hemerythrin domain-containing protein [Diaphorobacter sp.]|uniref:hemerythrin domain-containing protein n=1 Tax=Diaphorobacter sp. TaxID=1934310 RepID=UPI0028A81D36|nr:hemerythrin domain-containing protein [Diaphorobacter sp.]